MFNCGARGLAHLAIFPPVLVLEFGGAALKLRSSGLQGIGPVVQLRQLLVPLQDFVHVHAHDVDHLRHRNSLFTSDSEVNVANVSSAVIW